MTLRPIIAERCAEKPDLDAVLNEPITRLLMQRDRTDRAAIEALLDRARLTRCAAAPGRGASHRTRGGAAAGCRDHA